MFNIFTNSVAGASTDWSHDDESLLARVKAWFAHRKDDNMNDEVAGFIEHHGGVLTDDLEREISRRFGTMAGR